MVLTFSENAWEDYVYWQKTDNKMVKKINELIKFIKRTPFERLGKTQPQKYDFAA